jgi:hypothetical protein
MRRERELKRVIRAFTLIRPEVQSGVTRRQRAAGPEMLFQVAAAQRGGFEMAVLTQTDFSLPTRVLQELKRLRLRDRQEWWRQGWGLQLYHNIGFASIGSGADRTARPEARNGPKDGNFNLALANLERKSTFLISPGVGVRLPRATNYHKRSLKRLAIFVQCAPSQIAIRASENERRQFHLALAVWIHNLPGIRPESLGRCAHIAFNAWQQSRQFELSLLV